MNDKFMENLYHKRESLREYIADETLHLWRQHGVLSLNVDYYKAKEKLMEYLQDIGI